MVVINFIFVSAQLISFHKQHMSSAKNYPVLKIIHFCFLSDYFAYIVDLFMISQHGLNALQEVHVFVKLKFWTS